MNQLECPEKKGFFGRVKSELCFRVKNFITKHSKNMCFTKQEVRAIRDRVKETIEKEQKFNDFKDNVAPVVLDSFETLRERIDVLEREKFWMKQERDYFLNFSRAIYLAYISGDVEKVKILIEHIGSERFSNILEDSDEV